CSSTCRAPNNRAMPCSPSRGHMRTIRCAAEAYIEQNYARDISIERLARELNMSPRNFIRRFKGATGRLPGNYPQAMRVAVAKEMLEDGARSLRAVSAAVRYRDGLLSRRVQALNRHDTWRIPRELPGRELCKSARPIQAGQDPEQRGRNQFSLGG